MRRIIWLPFIALLCMSMTGCAGASIERKDVLKRMQIAFLGDKAEDAILFFSDDFTVLVDAGLNKTGGEIVEYLRKNGIQKLDLLLISHYDKDHVGGADSVLREMQVNRVISPDYSSDAKQYEQFVKAAAQKGILIEYLSSNYTLNFGDLILEIDAPGGLYEQENDRSLVVRATYGNCSFLLTGDAENARLSELLNEGVSSCTLLKVPHHGRYEKLSQAFFLASKPQYAVITSDEKEPEDDLVVGMLEQVGAKVLLTRLGFIEGFCDGRELHLTQSAY